MTSQHRSVYELFQEVVRTHGDGMAYHYEQGDGWGDVTWNEQGATVGRLSRTLVALGIEKGDRVGILSRTRYEWVQCDLGIVNAGAVSVGIYPSNLADACAYILQHSDCRVVFVENAEQLEKVQATRSGLPQLEHVVLIEGSTGGQRGVLGWHEFLDLGRSVSDEELRRRGEALTRADLASLVYTSGTTGAPKGAMISHGNLLSSIESISQCLRFYPDYSTLMFLPLAHVFARMMSYCCLACGLPVHYTNDMLNLGQKLQQVRPHFIIAVPRLYEKFHEKIVTTVERAGGVKPRLFRWAVAVGTDVSQRRLAGKPVPPLLSLRHAVADALVLRKVRAAFGGRLVWAVSGAAPLNEAIARFFHACGVTILEGIGMTENTSFSNVNRLDANKLGTVGQAGPGIEIKIAGDGEVLIRAPNVMLGYFKDPEATREAIDEQGFLHTGDIGEIDDEGFLRITDRKKDLIITAGGKNVAPQRVERILRESRFISQAVAYGDRQRFLSALITLDEQAVREWARGQGLGELSAERLAASPAVRELIGREIEARNAQLASFETIKRFFILPRDLSIESGELTPTLKVKRKVIVERYRDELESLYAEG